MEIAAKIREIGFKRWYERQLIESHAYLVTCFLSMIAVAVTLEVPSLMRLGFETLVRLAIAFGGIALCVVAWKQYSEWCSPTFWGRARPARIAASMRRSTSSARERTHRAARKSFMISGCACAAASAY